MNKRAFIRKLILASILVICGTLGSAAQVRIPEIKLRDTVSRGSQVSYLELIKKVFPDAQMNEAKAELARAKNKRPLRNLLIKELDDFFRWRMTGELDIAVTASTETVNGREKLLWLLIGVSETGEECEICGNTILAAYRVRKTDAELIDAASVKTSSFVSFSETPKITLAPQREAVVIYNEDSTNMKTNFYSIIAPGDKGFDVLLKEFEESSIYKCGYYIEETARFRPLKTSVGGFRQLEVTVKSESGWYEDEGKVEKRGAFRYVFSWQPREKKYKAVANPEKARNVFFKKNSPCSE